MPTARLASTLTMAPAADLWIFPDCSISRGCFHAQTILTAAPRRQIPMPGLLSTSDTRQARHPSSAHSVYADVLARQSTTASPEADAAAGHTVSTAQTAATCASQSPTKHVSPSTPQEALHFEPSPCISAPCIRLPCAASGAFHVAARSQRL